METIKQLQEKRGALAAEIRKLADLISKENRNFTAEEDVQWKKVNADYDANQAKLDEANNRASIQARADSLREETQATEGRGAPGRTNAVGNTGSREVTEETRAVAFSAWCRQGYGMAITDDEEEACRAVGLRLDRGHLDIPLFSNDNFRAVQRQFRTTHPSCQHDIRPEQRTLSAYTPASGGYVTFPTELVNSLEINMLAFGGMLQSSEIMTTGHGNRIAWPTADDTSNTGVQLGESTSIGSSVDPSFAQVYLDAYKFSSKAILVPYELLEDSAFNLPGILGSMLGERLGRISNTKFTTGTGAATPKGITNCTTLGVTTGVATTITADETLGLVHSIDPAYRVGAGWMMHDGVLLYLRKLKDGNSNYIWQNGMNAGAPDSLWSYPITINQDMQSTVATATKTVLFGQLSKYKIRRVNGVRLYRLQERYRDTDQDGFIAFLRQDGNMLTAGTAPIKHILQA